MIKCTRIFTRPSTDIGWHTDQPFWTNGFANHMQTNYLDTGKCIMASNTISPDGLVRTYEAFWNSQADYDEYDVDPYLDTFWQQRNTYYSNVGVIMSDVLLEVV